MSNNGTQKKPGRRYNNNKQSKKQLSANDPYNEPSEAELNDENQCIICANKITYAALSECNHKTCHVCSFRQRALYEKNSCLVCRTEINKLVITEEIQKEFNDIKDSEIIETDSKYNIRFTSIQSRDATLNLLIHCCPVCMEKFSTFKLLNDHVATHEKHYCMLCATHKKAFTYELKLYTAKQLQKHQTTGDEKGFTGHPLCKFCKGKRFYSEDELLVHLRQNHEKCHVCDQIDSSNPQYFKNYNSLEEHFRRDHYICNVQSCLDEKFVVFADELDLQAHMLTRHPGLAGNVVGTSHFNNNGNKFRSQLSTFRPINNNTSSSSVNRAANSSSDLDVKKLRLEERARHYCNSDNSKLEEFKKVNKDYKFDKLSELEVLQRYKEIFSNTKEDEIYLLIHELSEIFPANSKKNLELSKLVTKYENIAKHEENFPALPGSSSGLNIYGASWGGRSGSSSGSSSRSNSKKSLDEQFPALPKSTKSFTPVKTTVKKTVKYKTFANLQPAPPTTVRINRSSPASTSNYVPNYLENRSKPKPTAEKVDENLFPALPALPKKKVIPRVNPIPEGNGVWSTASSSSVSAPPTANNDSFDLSTIDNSLPSTGKGKKKKKIVLFQSGGH